MLNQKVLDERLSGVGDGVDVENVKVEGESGELSDLWRPDEETASVSAPAFEDQLCERGHVTAEQLEQARLLCVILLRRNYLRQEAHLMREDESTLSGTGLQPGWGTVKLIDMLQRKSEI